MHAILGFQPQVKAEAINLSHFRILCLNARKPLGQQDERIFVVGMPNQAETSNEFDAQFIGVVLGQQQKYVRPAQPPVECSSRRMAGFPGSRSLRRNLRRPSAPLRLRLPTPT